MRTVPDAAVVACLDRQPADSAWITGITLFEARFGLALLPLGRRRQTLEAAFAHLLKEDLEIVCWIFTALQRRSCVPVGHATKEGATGGYA
jgi:toxin FitB